MRAAFKEGIPTRMDLSESERSRGEDPQGPGQSDGETLRRVSLTDVLENARPLLTREGSMRFLLISSKYLNAGLNPRSLVPILRKGAIDVIIASPILLDVDLGLSGPGGGRRPNRGTDSKGEARGLLLIHDVPMERRIVQYPRHFVSLIITASKFQRVTASATITRNLGRYFKEREKLLKESPGLLSTAYELGIPVYVPDIMASELGNVISGQALDGNRLGHDPALDINEVAGLMLESRDPDSGCVVLSLGGGTPLRFVLRSSRYLQETLGIRELLCQSAFIFTESEDRLLHPDTDSRRRSSKERLTESLSGYAAASEADEAVESLSRMMEALPDRPPRNLEDQREGIWERLRKAHVEATALKNWPPLKMKFPGLG
jgi:deoxyhypusine synthase